MPEVEFPAWLRIGHVLNIVFLTLLARSGLQVLAAHPRLYWNDDCEPRTGWISFTRRRVPEDGLMTGKDEEVAPSSLLALPGGHRLGLGRHWHFAAAAGWILVGVTYVALLFATGEWGRLLPERWSIVPEAWRAVVDYLHLRAPEPMAGEPYNALQQLTYGAVVFVLAPLQIATGAAMSPAVANAFPRFLRLFGGRQAARTLHFLGLGAFALFAVGHTALVLIEGVLPTIVQGRAEASMALALFAFGAFVLGLGLLHLAATRVSLADPRAVQRALDGVVGPAQRGLARSLRPSLRRSATAPSPHPRVNGRPPADAAYAAMAEAGFAAWRLEVGGLVARPLELSLADLRDMPRRTQTALHHCIQGWSYRAEWGGVPLSAVLSRCGPLPAARVVVFRAMDDKARSEPDPEGDGHFYETLDLSIARQPHVLLADEMNGEPLPVVHGAPLRLRVENQLGYKMVKYLWRIELVADAAEVGGGHGGWREDHQWYAATASV